MPLAPLTLSSMAFWRLLGKAGQPMTKAELLEAAAKQLAEVVILLEAAGEQTLAFSAEDLEHQVEIAIGEKCGPKLHRTEP